MPPEEKIVWLRRLLTERPMALHVCSLEFRPQEQMLLDRWDPFPSSYVTTPGSCVCGGSCHRLEIFIFAILNTGRWLASRRSEGYKSCLWIPMARETCILRLGQRLRNTKNLEKTYEVRDRLLDTTIRRNLHI